MLSACLLLEFVHFIRCKIRNYPKVIEKKEV